MIYKTVRCKTVTFAGGVFVFIVVVFVIFKLKNTVETPLMTTYENRPTEGVCLPGGDPNYILGENLHAITFCVVSCCH